MIKVEEQFKELMMKRTSKKLYTNIQNLTCAYIAISDSSFNALRDAIEEYNGYIASKQGHKLLCTIHYIENARNTCKGCRWYDICTTGIGRIK